MCIVLSIAILGFFNERKMLDLFAIKNYLLQSKLFFELYQDKLLENMMTITEAKKREKNFSPLSAKDDLRMIAYPVKKSIFNLRNSKSSIYYR